MAKTRGRADMNARVRGWTSREARACARTRAVAGVRCALRGARWQARGCAAPGARCLRVCAAPGARRAHGCAAPGARCARGCAVAGARGPAVAGGRRTAHGARGGGIRPYIFWADNRALFRARARARHAHSAACTARTASRAPVRAPRARLPPRTRTRTARLAPCTRARARAPGAAHPRAHRAAGAARPREHRAPGAAHPRAWRARATAHPARTTARLPPRTSAHPRVGRATSVRAPVVTARLCPRARAFGLPPFFTQFWFTGA